jgi:hypothetical protein
MRTYLWVIAIIFGLMGVYVALLPIAVWSDSRASVSTTGPF